VKINRRQIRQIVESYGQLPDDLNFQVAMKIKDMMPPDEALGMMDPDLKALAASVFDDHFDTTGEGWDPYDEDVQEIQDHLTVLPMTEETYEKVLDAADTKDKEGVVSEMMNITENKLRNMIREALITEIFGFGKKKPEVYHKVFLDVGYTERNIKAAIPNLAKTLSDKKVDPEDVATAMAKLLQSPKDHIAGIPGGKAIFKELKKMGAIK